MFYIFYLTESSLLFVFILAFIFSGFLGLLVYHLQKDSLLGYKIHLKFCIAYSQVSSFKKYGTNLYLYFSWKCFSIPLPTVSINIFKKIIANLIQPPCWAPSPPGAMQTALRPLWESMVWMRLKSRPPHPRRPTLFRGSCIIKIVYISVVQHDLYLYIVK